MVQPTTPNPPNTPLVGPDGRVTRDWWRFFFNINRATSEAAAGDVATPPGSGLEGGGAVSNGVSLSIADNGVTNAMLRQSAGTSVIGRFAGSTGNVADITAVQNGVVLSRLGNQLVFTPSPEVTNLTASGTVTTAALSIEQAPVAATPTPTHTFTITLDGVDYLVPCVVAP